MTLHGRSHRENEQGVTYIMVMFAIVLISLSMTVAAKQWKTMIQRELEADLLAKGIEIQSALALYSTTMKAGRVVPGEIYPNSLADLTRPPKPFLRKIYPDPVGHGEWEILRAPTGGVMGVRSKSKAKPIRTVNFPPMVRHFEGRQSYRDWIFQHPNPSSSGITTLAPVGTAPAPGSPPGTPTPQTAAPAILPPGTPPSPSPNP
jgi:hypothetical protein